MKQIILQEIDMKGEKYLRRKACQNNPTTIRIIEEIFDDTEQKWLKPHYDVEVGIADIHKLHNLLSEETL